MEALPHPPAQERSEPLPGARHDEAHPGSGVRLAQVDRAAGGQVSQHPPHQVLLRGRVEIVQDVDEQHPVRARRLEGGEIGRLDARHTLERPGGDAGDARTSLDAEKLEVPSRRPGARPRGVQERHRDAAAAPEIDEAAAVETREAIEERPVDRVPAQLAAHELPVERRAVAVAQGGRFHERGPLRVALPPPRDGVGGEPEDRREDRAEDETPDEEVAAERHRPLVDEPLEAEGRPGSFEETVAEPVGKRQEPGRRERVVDVRREIRHETVQPEEPRQRQAEQQVRAVDRSAADERAQRHGGRLPRRGVSLGPQRPVQLAQVPVQALPRPAPGRRRGRRLRLRRQRRPPPVKARERCAGPPRPRPREAAAALRARWSAAPPRSRLRARRHGAPGCPPRRDRAGDAR